MKKSICAIVIISMLSLVALNFQSKTALATSSPPSLSWSYTQQIDAAALNRIPAYISCSQMQGISYECATMTGAAYYVTIDAIVNGQVKPAQTIDTLGGAPEGVSCTTSQASPPVDYCIAFTSVSSSVVAYANTGSTGWVAITGIPGNISSVSAVACFATSECVVATNNHYIYLYNASATSQWTLEGTLPAQPTSIACAPNVQWCQIGAATQVFSYTASGLDTNGSTPATASTSQSQDAGYDVTGLSCANQTFCLGVLTSPLYNDAYVSVWNPSASSYSGWSPPTQLSTPQTALTVPGYGISCPTTTMCMLVDSAGDTYLYLPNGLMYQTSVANADAADASGNQVADAACAAPAFCYALTAPINSTTTSVNLLTFADNLPPATPIITDLSPVQDGFILQLSPGETTVTISGNPVSIYPPITGYTVALSTTVGGAIACTTTGYAAPPSVNVLASAPDYSATQLAPNGDCTITVSAYLTQSSTTTYSAGSATDTITISSSSTPEFFQPITPTRICDTRAQSLWTPVNQCNNNGSGNPITLNGSTTQVIPTNILTSSGAPLIPSTANAISANITVTNFNNCPTSPCWGYLSTWASNAQIPITSNVNWTGNLPVVTNAATIPLGTNGGFYVGSGYGTTETVDVMIDINGYYSPVTPSTPSPIPGLFNTVNWPPAPIRICDTRSGSGYACSGGGPLTPTHPITLNVGQYLPSVVQSNSDVSAVELSVQAVNNTTNGNYISVLPGSTVPPVLPVSSLNPQVNEVTSNRVIVPVTGMTFTLADAMGSTDVIVDFDGFFTAGTSSYGGHLFYTTPASFRVVDTRSLFPTNSSTSAPYSYTTLNASTYTTYTITSTGGINYNGQTNPYYLPQNVSFALVNTTVLNTTSWGYDSVLPPPPEPASPSTSDTLWQTANSIVAEMDIVSMTSSTTNPPPSDSDNAITVYNGSNTATCPSGITGCGTIGLLVDVQGWFI